MVGGWGWAVAVAVAVAVAAAAAAAVVVVAVVVVVEDRGLSRVSIWFLESKNPRTHYQDPPFSGCPVWKPRGVGVG